MEKPGIEPATPGLQGIALIHYTTGGLEKPYNKLNYLAVEPKVELSMQKISNMYGCSLEVNLHIRTS